MRGSIIKRYKGSYTIVLNLGTDPQTGKRRQQWISVKGTRKDAERKLAELLHQLDTGTFMKPGKTTLGQFLEQWLKDYVCNLGPKTAESYEHIIHRHLIPFLGAITLTGLKPEHLQKCYSEKLSGGLSAQSVRHCHTVLHTALQTAIKWGLLTRNVADAVKLPQVQRHEIQTWNEDEIHQFLDAARDMPNYALFYLALFTGARRNELLALRWCDIDFILSQIYMTRTLHHLNTGEIVFTQPKSARSRRTIALSPSAILMLQDHKEKQKVTRAMMGIPVKDDDLVFSHLDGSPLLPGSVTHAWIKLVRRTALKPIRLHDARHTHASLMLKQGIHPKVVQERLGHASIQITLDTYSHVAPGLQEAAAKRFDELVNHKPENEAVENFG